MRNRMCRVAFVGVPDRDVAESLREYGYRLEAVAPTGALGLARAVYRLRPSVVHARAAHLKAAIVGKLFDLPVVAHISRADFGPLTARAARLASRVVCGGAAVREQLIAQGVAPSAATVLRGLLDVGDELRAAALFPPMLDPAIRWVVAAGPCDGSDRGHQDLILAFHSIARTRPRLKLLIAGEGADAPRLRAQAQAAGMLNRVVVHPIGLEQLPSVFARAAVVIGPSRSAVLPDPLPEALAVGAPVIATAVGFHANWVREGRTGWLVAPHAPVALAARMAQVVDDPILARRTGQNARQAALALAAPRAVAQELARSYAMVSRVPSPPSTGIHIPAARRLQRV
ncbi:MAG TPA: glycosyltransferase [Myxococcales bacterium]|nr:glycosyltransferase [Myxococcales bacterium]